MKDQLFYKVVRPLLSLFISLYKPIIINKDNIPKDKGVILVGNHTSYLDPLLVAKGTRRAVHFFAKDSLYKGIKKPLFKGLGIIPVNRQVKDKNSLSLGYKALNNGLVVGVFPEGTINKTKDIIMPFKFGAVKMASVTKTNLVPFAIIGKYKFLRKSVKIVYGKPYTLESNDLEKENNKLMEKVINLVKENR